MTVQFWLDNPNTPEQLCYLPYGTRSLRIKVRTKETSAPLRLRPHVFLQEDQDQGLFCGYENGVEHRSEANFELSWGGGQEQGPPTNAVDRMGAFEIPIPLEAGQERVLIFNLTHIGQEVPTTAQLTMQAVDVITGEVKSTITITLIRPSSYQPNIARLVPEGDGRWAVANGDLIPQYEARWWPEDKVEYTAAPSQIPLRIIATDNADGLDIYWGETHIAHIQDDSNPPVLLKGTVRPEIFAFDEHYIALRLWFFWLNVNIGGSFFIGRHEVPDSERFDFLILRKDGSVPLACTDLHWRESWGMAEQLPIQGTIGLSRATKIELGKDALSKMWKKMWGEEAKESDKAYNPLKLVRRFAKRHASGRGATTTRGKGTEAHVPMLKNVDSSNEKLTSSDVRLG